MGTTDGNSIYFYETTDPVSPLQVLLNTGQQSVSDALNGSLRIFPVANLAAKTALLAAKGSSAAAPLNVYQQDTDTYERHNGTAWAVYGWFPSTWTTISSFSANFSADPVITPKWRLNRDRIELTGVIRKSGAVTAAPENMCSIGAGQQPAQQQNVAAALWASGSGQPGHGFIVIAAGGQLQVAEKTGTVDRISLGGISYPLV